MELLQMSKKELTRLEVIGRLKAKKMTQKKAGEALGISVRQVKRLCKNYREKGAAGLVSQRRGKPSNNRLPAETKQAAMDRRTAGSRSAPQPALFWHSSMMPPAAYTFFPISFYRRNKHNFWLLSLFHINIT